MVNSLNSAKGRREFGDHPFKPLTGRARRRKIEQRARRDAKKAQAKHIADRVTDGNAIYGQFAEHADKPNIPDGAA